MHFPLRDYNLRIIHIPRTIFFSTSPDSIPSPTTTSATTTCTVCRGCHAVALLSLLSRLPAALEPIECTHSFPSLLTVLSDSEEGLTRTRGVQCRHSQATGVTVSSCCTALLGSTCAVSVLFLSSFVSTHDHSTGWLGMTTALATSSSRSLG